ncbi:hypothetical protein UlMin_036382 [Ulmus minor]
MASSKVLASSNSRNSDLSRRSSSASSSAITKPKPLPLSDTDHRRKASIESMTVDGYLRNVYDANPTTESTLLDAQISLIDTPLAGAGDINSASVSCSDGPRSVEDVWQEIVSGKKECKEEATDVLMTLEDFLMTRTGSVNTGDEEVKQEKLPPPITQRLSGGIFGFDSISPTPLQALDKVEGSIIGFGNGVDVIGGGTGGRGKRGRAVMEPLDKAAQQRQRRMIKNRESAARSRERKQAYQVELETLSVRLQEENEQLEKEKEERTKKRYKQLMEKIIPVEEKQKPAPPRVLRRTRSMQW